MKIINRYNFDEEKHIHLLDGRPLIGTTTALGIISKELTWWASGMAVGSLGWLHKGKDKDGVIPFRDKERLASREIERLVFAGTKLTEIKLMTVQEYIDLLDMAYRAHNAKKESRAQEGTDLHELVERWIKAQMDVAPFKASGENLIGNFDKLKPFIDWCEKNVKRFLFSEIHCYSERLGCGGKTDFGYEDIIGNYVLADAKSRDKDYFSDHLQVGLYDIQLSENGGFDKNGNLIWDGAKKAHFDKHAIFTLGEAFKEPVISASAELNRRGGEFAINLYKVRQQFEGKS